MRTEGPAFRACLISLKTFAVFPQRTAFVQPSKSTFHDPLLHHYDKCSLTGERRYPRVMKINIASNDSYREELSV